MRKPSVEELLVGAAFVVLGASAYYGITHETYKDARPVTACHLRVSAAIAQYGIDKDGDAQLSDDERVALREVLRDDARFNELGCSLDALLADDRVDWWTPIAVPAAPMPQMPVTMTYQ